MTIKLYRVGGAVRDAFMGVKSKDIDYAVEAPSYETMRDYIAANGKIYLETPEYFTIRAKMNGEDADFVLCRKDGSYSDGRRPDSVQIGDIYDDLARRDFTMNAIAVAEDGTIIDPYNGMQDINSNMIRCVGNAEDRMREDSLRLLRAIRFSITKGMHISNQIDNELFSTHTICLLRNVSKERIRDELNKCFRFDTLATLRMLDRYSQVRAAIFADTDTWLEATNKAK
jgi:tRNA nucleotidyltransferase (CCA-adding enzyme)